MPAPLNPNLWPSVLHDEDGVPISAANPLPVSGVIGDISPGDLITTEDDTTVAPGATVPLPVAPANTRRVRIQVVDGDDDTKIRVREVGGAAGSGILLTFTALGSTMYGGIDGAIADLEVENVASSGVDAKVAVQFEGD